jgi:hypothetical protein
MCSGQSTIDYTDPEHTISREASYDALRWWVRISWRSGFPACTSGLRWTAILVFWMARSVRMLLFLEHILWSMIIYLFVRFINPRVQTAATELKYMNGLEKRYVQAITRIVTLAMNSPALTEAHIQGIAWDALMVRVSSFLCVASILHSSTIPNIVCCRYVLLQLKLIRCVEISSSRISIYSHLGRTSFAWDCARVVTEILVRHTTTWSHSTMRLLPSILAHPIHAQYW